VCRPCSRPCWSPPRFPAPGSSTSAVNLKFLSVLLQSHHRNFKFKNRTRNINLLVLLRFQSSHSEVAANICELRNRSTRGGFNLRASGRIRRFLKTAGRKPASARPYRGILSRFFPMVSPLFTGGAKRQFLRPNSPKTDDQTVRKMRRSFAQL
jgi:hypothetical protein